MKAAPVPEQHPNEPSTNQRRRTLNAFIAGVLLATVAAAGAFVVTRSRPTNGGAKRFEHNFAKDYLGTVNIGITGPAKGETAITVTWGQLRTTFPHTGPTRKEYFFERGVLDERQTNLVINTDQPVSVDFSAEPAHKEGIDIGATPWQPLAFSHGTVPARPANSDSLTATASVDETVTYGGPVPGPGISIKEHPAFGGNKLDTVHLAESYPAACWITGVVVTNSNYSDPSDDLAAYTTPIWWYIETKKAKGFISDVWFARRANTDKLNLPECPKDLTGTKK
jgi:hypothetical protein